jgi:signal recognition particle GTPase
MLDELEMLLVQADIGAKSAVLLMDRIRGHIKKPAMLQEQL